MTTRGFFLGKFMPPHRGHLFVAETALRLCKRLSVLVCSTDAEPIDGALRAGWMRRLLPDADILHLHRNLPQAPEDDPDFWPIWRAAILEAEPRVIDRVFGSEPYVFRLAHELGAEPVIVDPEREVFNIRASAIRAEPARCWADIPEIVRPHFQKRLTILGPESVGKTRLAAALAQEFSTRVAPEYGRTYDVHYKRGKNWRAEDFAALAETHRAMREAMAGEAGPLLIEDTDALQTAVWSLFIVGEIAPALEKIERETIADHYFLLTPEVVWVQDGVRYAGSDETRAFFFEEARRRLSRLGAAFDIIAGADIAARTAAAIARARAVFLDC